MPIRSPLSVALVAAAIAAAGCQPASSSFAGLERLGDMRVSETARAASVSFKVVDLLPKPARRVQYVTVPDWSQATITLRRNGVTIGSQNVTPDATQETTVRSAASVVTFNGLNPGTGYRIEVTLTGTFDTDGDGTQESGTIATGASNDVTIKAGANTVTVSLTLNGATVTPVISQPTLSAGSLGATVSVGTSNAYRLARLAGRTYDAAYWGANGEDHHGGANAADATIRHVTGIATDTDGSVYFADPMRRTIRKITSAGVMSLYAGQGDGGAAEEGDPAGVTAAGAAITPPFGLVLDPGANATATADDRLFFADPYSHRIKYVSAADGRVWVYAGAGDAAPAPDPAAANDMGAVDIGMPAAIAMDDNGDMYFTVLHGEDADDVLADDGTRIWRLEAATGRLTQIFRIPGAYASDTWLRSIAIDRTNNRLYVTATTAAGGCVLLVVGNIAGGIDAGTLLGTVSLDDYATPMNVAFDQYGYLYAGQAATSLKTEPDPDAYVQPWDDVNVKYWRIPINLTTGLQRAGLNRVRIAGTGATTGFEPSSTVFTSVDAPTAEIADATAQRLMGHNYLALHVDPYSTGSGSPQRVFVGSSYFGDASRSTAWGQLIRLTAPAVP